MRPKKGWDCALRFKSHQKKSQIILAFPLDSAHLARQLDLIAQFHARRVIDCFGFSKGFRQNGRWTIGKEQHTFVRRKRRSLSPNYFSQMAMSSTAEMSVEQSIELEGTIQTVLPGTMFRVTLDNQHEVLAHISGKMRRHFVRLTAGDRVRLEMSPYDLSKARITYRLR
jgi:translation initiation factor IF-1